MSLADLLQTETKGLTANDMLYLQDAHVTFLRKHPDTKIIHVEGLDADRFTGDFYGLLTFLNVAPEHQYFMLKVNGLLSSADYDGKANTLIAPSTTAMNRIFTIYDSRAST